MNKQVKKLNKKNFNKSTGSSKINTELDKKQKVTITDWYYMTPGDVNAKMIADRLKINGFSEVELWEEMNILQIELADKKTVDFEPVGYSFKDPSDVSFIKNRNIKTIFAVTLEEGNIELFRPVLKILLEEWEGFLCADSIDFKPIYGKGDV